MRGVQKAKRNRAISGDIADSFPSLPAGDWSLQLFDHAGNRIEKGVLMCENVQDVAKIKRIYGSHCREDTPVFGFDGRKVTNYVGEVNEVLAQASIREVPAPSRTEYLTDISDLLVEEPAEPEETVFQLDDRDIIDVLDTKVATREKTDRFNESARFDNLFKERYELGMNIDYFTRTSKKGETRHDFRYRRRMKEGVAGGWVSKDYVYEAVTALDKYDKLVKSDSTTDLTKACEIATKYFTVEAKADARKTIAKQYAKVAIKNSDWKALRNAKETVNKYLNGDELKSALSAINLQMEHEAVWLSGYANGRNMDRSTAIQVYSFLIQTGKPFCVEKAVPIAATYLGKDVAMKTGEHLRKLEMSYDNTKLAIPPLPPRPQVPDSPDMYDKDPEVRDSGVYVKGKYEQPVAEGSGARRIAEGSGSRPPPIPKGARMNYRPRPQPVPKMPETPLSIKPITPAYGAVA